MNSRLTNPDTVTSDVTKTRVWRIRPGAVTWKQLAGETVVLDISDSSYLSLNGAATLLWSTLVDGGGSELELVSTLLDTFDVDDDMAATDVQSFIAVCQDRNWID